MERQNKVTRSISISTEIDNYVESEAKNGHRPFSWQVELMLNTAKAVMEGSLYPNEVAQQLPAPRTNV